MPAPSQVYNVIPALVAPGEVTGPGQTSFGAGSGGGGGGGVASVTAGDNVVVTGTATDPIVGTVENPNFTTSVTTPLVASSGDLALSATGGTIDFQDTLTSVLALTHAGTVVEITGAGTTTEFDLGDSGLAKLRLNSAFIQMVGGGSELDVASGYLQLIADTYYLRANAMFFDDRAANSTQTTFDSTKTQWVYSGARIIDVPQAGTTTGAQTISLATSNDIQLGALTGDTAITWSNTSDGATPPCAMNWTLTYYPTAHHATFPGSAFPIAPASLNAAALATAETTATLVTMWWHCSSDGRISCTWTAA